MYNIIISIYEVSVIDGSCSITHHGFILKQTRAHCISSKKSEKKIFFSRGPIEGTVEIHFFSSERRRFSSTFKSGRTISRRDSIRQVYLDHAVNKDL